jgi:hypothetical protein
MRYVVECGTPSVMRTPHATRYEVAATRARPEPNPITAQNKAKAWLRKSEQYLTRYDTAALKRLRECIDIIGNTTMGQWAHSSSAEPMRWTIDVGWTTLCVEMWREG